MKIYEIYRRRGTKFPDSVQYRIVIDDGQFESTDGYVDWSIVCHSIDYFVTNIAKIELVTDFTFSRDYANIQVNIYGEIRTSNQQDVDDFETYVGKIIHNLLKKTFKIPISR